MPAFRTVFQGYSVRFSPFEEGKLAVATSQNFGIIGNGKQYVLQVRVRMQYGILMIALEIHIGQGPFEFKVKPFWSSSLGTPIMID